MHWKLKISEYGKIKSAEIEAALFTLFVGDNNSGKSYLMSLLWGIQNLGAEALIYHRAEADRNEAAVLMKWIKKQISEAWKQGSHVAQVREVGEELQTVLQESLNQNKDKFVGRIFNSEDVKIRDLRIELTDLENICLKISKSQGMNDERTGFLTIRGGLGSGFRMEFSESRLQMMDGELEWALMAAFYAQIMEIPFGDMSRAGRDIYLPAARTGFMLTKDIINKVGRNAVFNVGTEEDEWIPFTRPINQFLDVMNDLSVSGRGEDELDEVMKFLENGMAEGTIEMSALPNKEVLYVPMGQEKGMPLRIVSAVVTELSPLILILKHKKYLQSFFYEEPEMCLHPQLQQRMARVLCQLVNAGLKIVITTHSDIILQHINNMICLTKREDRDAVCHQFGYRTGDLLRENQVKVYQLKANSQGETEVEELICGENGFAIPTFNDALDRIMDEAYAIQE